jgi:hypothetical protein
LSPIKAFTLIHLSPALDGSFNRNFKSNLALNSNWNILRLLQWNIVRILGKTTAKAETSSFTSSLKVKNYPYAGNAGVA